MESSKRMATLVGCNYSNTPHELHGCINDVLSMRDTLVNLFGFQPNHVELLTDDDAPGGSSAHIPTGSNIMKSLNRMLDLANPGDVLFFHYSGHGTTIPSKHHIFGRGGGEAIVPCDFNLITDVDFRQLVNRLPEKSSFTIISDSCHSGGLIDKEKEQIGPSATNSPPNHPRNIHLNYIFDHLASLSSIQSSDIGAHLLDIFGKEASVKFQQNEDNKSTPLPPDSGILLSGCQANETSADVNPTSAGGKACGAFSNALQLVFKTSGTSVSNKDLIINTRRILEEQGFHQHPCLYCSDNNAEAPFLLMST